MPDVTWAGRNVDSVIAGKVDASADANGLPRNVLRAEVLEESGGNPYIEGDAGASIGLHQLHAAGQGKGMSIAQRRDPDQNLAVGTPYIAAAWKAHAHLSGRDRVFWTMTKSGHPGDIDRIGPGYERDQAVRNITRIVDTWERLEREQPTVAAGTTVAGLPAERVQGALDDAQAWVRAHPVAAAAIAGGAALLLL